MGADEGSTEAALRELNDLKVKEQHGRIRTVCKANVKRILLLIVESLHNPA